MRTAYSSFTRPRSGSADEDVEGNGSGGSGRGRPSPMERMRTHTPATAVSAATGTSTTVQDGHATRWFGRTVRSSMTLATVLGMVALLAFGFTATRMVLPPDQGTATLASASQQGTVKPALSQDDKVHTMVKHVVLVLADDLGINDLGVYNQEMEAITPTLTSLAEQGVVFSKYYSMHRCTPARSALLTGKQPYRLGMQVDNITPATPFALPRSAMIIPEFLQEQGFKSHLVGKWNQGHVKEENMPHQRGFDSFFGYLTDEIDYYTHKYPNSFDGLHFKDYMRANADGFRYVESTQFSMEDFMDEAVDVVEQHDPEENLFLYFASQAPHGPVVTAPASMLSAEQAAAIEAADPSRVRQDYLSLVASLDTSVAAIVDALKEKGMWDDTLLIFASDNGACNNQGGLNLPLLGGKSSLFEGGFHVPAFVHHSSWSRDLGDSEASDASSASFSALHPTAPANVRVFGDLFRVTDWLPTILSSVGARDVVKSTGMDGVSHWDKIAAMGSAAGVNARQDVVAQVFGPMHESTTEVLWYSSYDRCCDDDSDKGSCYICPAQEATGAAIHEGYKYIFSSGTTGYWTDFPDDDSYFGMDNCGNAVSSTDTQDFLFNLDVDVAESTNLIDSEGMDGPISDIQSMLSTAAYHESVPLFRADKEVEAATAWEPTGFIGPYAQEL